ncbi:MAG TPA: DUF1802 family protein [Planctomycetaceae bacterium]|jgi:hypothetical protein|nr:DUF1802 family protein [Planctomycetaceae bacterium]
MQPTNRWAFKEWAAVCSALLSGRQSLILRKGGIHEGRVGFRVDHPEFWLFATGFHQQPEALQPGAMDHALSQPASGTILLPGYAVVEAVEEIHDPAVLPRLSGHHVWSDRTIDERFHYRSPGLFALIVRVYRPPSPLALPDSPHFAGCRSWVDLPDELPTANLTPVLSDDEHPQRVIELQRALTLPQIV